MKLTKEEKKIIDSLEVFDSTKLVGVAFALLCSHLQRFVVPEKRAEMLFSLIDIILQAVTEEENKIKKGKSRH